ncbi:unnamed protein product [Protopolystoma xenopodis]|uniref:Uncharacterized protein n=1 Tax=Protopolystoma xenopodis TaxID=117903 RepID=A0A448XBZ1_9PLAT|nr:unnamed protein product [Protopolystoma xenopodis]
MCPLVSGIAPIKNISLGHETSLNAANTTSTTGLQCTSLHEAIQQAALVSAAAALAQEARRREEEVSLYHRIS